MKEWFKHQFGYVNIDEENVYVTKTGNWSEVKDLKEKNAGSFKFSDFRSKLKIGIYLFIALGLILFGFVSNILSGNFSLVLVIGLPVLAYTAFQYIIPEYGSSFVIPKSKIQEIHIVESAVSVYFLDTHNEPTSNRFLALNQDALETVKRLESAIDDQKSPEHQQTSLSQDI